MSGKIDYGVIFVMRLFFGSNCFIVESGWIRYFFFDLNLFLLLL